MTSDATLKQRIDGFSARAGSVPVVPSQSEQDDLIWLNRWSRQIFAFYAPIPFSLTNEAQRCGTARRIDPTLAQLHSGPFVCCWTQTRPKRKSKAPLFGRPCDPVVNWRYSVHLSPRATCCLILYHHPRLFPLVFFSRRFGVCFPFEVESNDKWLSGSSQAAVTSSMAGFMANVWPNKIKIEIPLSRVDGPPNWKASRSHPRSSTEMHPNDCIHRKHFKYCFQHLLDTSC